MRLTSSAVLFATLAVALPACSRPPSEPASTRPQGRLETVGAEEFKALAEKSGGIYLDVRTPGEVDRGHLPNTSVIDSSDPAFRRKVALLPRDKPIFVYCASGNRSGSAAALMQGMGFDAVYNLRGGIGAWVRAGYPVERTAAATPDTAEVMTPVALDALLQREKRVLIDYHTPWCAPCRAMRPIIEALANDWKGRAAVVRVDVSASEAVAAREGVEGVPVFVLYVDGKERWRRSGELSRDVLEEALARP